MDSTENSSWSQVRQRVLASGKHAQQRDIRFWASQKRAQNIIREIGKEVEMTAGVAPKIAAGECGVCRHRYLRLGINPAEFNKTSEKIDFGALYTVLEVSKSGTWIKIQLQKGQSGWVQSSSHFPISSGEHKVLKSLKRTNTLNFLVNALAATPF